MGSRFVAILTAVTAASAVLLGVSKIGPRTVVPGFDTGFEVRDDCSAGSVCLSTDGGDIRAMVTLSIVGPDLPARWRAHLSDGTPLTVRMNAWSPRSAELVLVKPDTTSPLAKFNWPSGIVVRVANAEKQPFQVRDWRVDVPDKEGFDSRTRAIWRGRWFAGALLVLVGALAAATLAPFASRPAKRDVETLCRELVSGTIDEMEGAPGEDMETMRALLRDVLLHPIPAIEAIQHRVPGKSRARQQQVWFAARARFHAHWIRVRSILDGYLGTLDTEQ